MMSAPQRSAQWLKDRVGFLTASVSEPVYKEGRKKGSRSEAWNTLKYDVAAQRITGLGRPSITTDAIEWGIMYEDDAVVAYEYVTGSIVKKTGFIKDTKTEWLGCSPDGLVGEDGLIEIKCPETRTLLMYMDTKEIPFKYQAQMMTELVVTGRKWCDFVVFDPRPLKEYECLRIHIQRFQPSSEEIENARKKCVEFLGDVEKLIIDLTNRKIFDARN